MSAGPGPAPRRVPPCVLAAALLAALLTLGATASRAQSPTAEEAPPEAPPPIVVEGGAQVVHPPPEAAAPPPLADPYAAGARTVIPRAAFRDTQRTVADVLETVPGVTVTRSGDALAGTRVTIRGSRSDQVLILLDGVPLTPETDAPAQRRAEGRAGVDLAALPLEQVESIEVVRGAASSLYGPGAAAGAILIRTRRAAEPALSFATTTGSDGYREGDVDWSTPLGPPSAAQSLRVHTNLRRSDGTYLFFEPDAVQGADAPPNPCAEPVGGGYFRRRCNATRTATLGLDWRQGPYRRAGAELERTRRDGLGGIENPRPYGLERVRRTRLRYEDAAALGSGGGNDGDDGSTAPLLHWQASAERLHSDRNENTSQPGTALTAAYTDDNATGEVRWEQWLRQHRLEAGTALAREVLDDQRFRAARSTASAFVAWELHAGSGTWEASLRRDDPSDLPGETTWRGALSQEVAGGFGLKASHGTGYRPPTLFERYDPGSFGDASVANPDLQPETSVSTDGGVFYHRGEVFSAELLAFRQEARSQIVALPAPASPNLLRFENVNRTRTTGLEASASLRPGAGWSADVTWTRQDARILDNDAVDPRDNGNQVPGVPDARWTAALAWRSAGWQVWGQARHSGRRYVDTANTRFLQPYTVLDAGLTVPLGAGFAAGVEGRNLTAATYAELDNFPPPGRQLFLTLRWQLGPPAPETPPVPPARSPR